MAHDDFGDYEPEERPRDEKIDEAKKVIVPRLFAPEPKRVFYSVQVETALEREYFHWITNRGLSELAAEGRLLRSEQIIAPHQQRVFFYTLPSFRYWKREAKALASTLSEIYDPDFTQAIGDNAELMFDSALARIGFTPVARNANSWQGRTWTTTKHNLDRIVVCDGITYGVEIKNTQNYISQEELRVKLQICSHLAIKPLFIMRFAPKNYMHDIWRAGGFGLLYEHQLYPLGHKKLAERVKTSLRLKVQCIRDIPAGDMNRLRNWHDRKNPRS